MKKAIKLTLAVVLVMGATSLFAQKFGRINTQEIIMAMPETKTMQENMDTFAKELSDNIETMNVEFNTKLQDFQKNYNTFSDAIKEVKEKELNDMHPAVLIVLKEAKSVREASDAVLLWYEKPADQSKAVQVKRAGYGQGYYEKYAGGGKMPSSGGMSNADCPFLVRITAKDLRIRKGNGTDTAWTGKYVPPGVYAVVEVKSGKGSDAGWGGLKSGAGWIALSYAKKV